MWCSHVKCDYITIKYVKALRLKFVQHLWRLNAEKYPANLNHYSLFQSPFGSSDKLVILNRRLTRILRLVTIRERGNGSLQD